MSNSRPKYPEGPTFFDLQRCLRRTLEAGRTDLAVVAARHIISLARRTWQSNPRLIFGEAEACIESLEFFSATICTSDLYFATAQLAVKAGRLAEADSYLTKLRALNDQALASCVPDSDDRETPFPGRVLELLEWAELARRQGQDHEALLQVKRALNRSWDLDVRLQALAVQKFREIALSLRKTELAEAMAALQERLGESVPEEPLRIFEPELWKATQTGETRC